MGTLTFKIISPDMTICGRWQKAFRDEGWLVDSMISCRPSEASNDNRMEIDLIEICVQGCKDPEDFKSLAKTRHPVAVLVFGDQQKISSRQIASFFDAGADDFVYKNIDERILVAKLKAYLRRIMPAISEATTKISSSCHSIEIDRNRRSVTIRLHPGKYMELSTLTPKEFDILSLLVTMERRVVTREVLLERLWGDGATDVYSECIDKHIESLRKKMGTCGNKIKTIYGSGYMFTGINKI
jgi:DNA-binding response OmpR family regulator